MQKPIYSRFGLRVILGLVIIAAILAVYGDLVQHPFHHFDDPIYVTNNFYVQRGITWDGLEWAFQSIDGANWHPLAWISHMADVQIFGGKPAGHYLSNILLHLSASLGLYILVYKISKDEWLSFFIALVWAVHPANVECVAWISQRKSLLASNMLFLGMIVYHRYRLGLGRYNYLLSIVFQLLASLAKPIAVLFPIALLLQELLTQPMTPGAKGFWANVREFIGRIFVITRRLSVHIFIAGGLSIVTFVAQDSSGATAYTYRSGVLWRTGNALESIYDYTLKVFTVPQSSVLYVLRPLSSMRIFYGVLLIIFIVLAVIAAWRRRQKAISVGFVWYLVMFLPTIGLIQVGSQRLADRYLNLPIIGILGVVIYSIWGLCSKLNMRYLAFVAVGAWAIGLAFQAKALCVDWNDVLRLSLNGLKVGGMSSSLLTNSAVEEVCRGHFDQARKYLDLIADENKAMHNLLVVDFNEKRYDDVIRRARFLYKDKDARMAAALLSARALEAQGKFEDAIRAYKGAISFLPAKRSYLLNVEIIRVALPALKTACEGKLDPKRP